MTGVGAGRPLPLRRHLPPDFFIMFMAVLDFVLMQINSLSFSFYNHSLFRILKVFKSMRALRAIRVLRRLRSEWRDSEGRGDTGLGSQGIHCGTGDVAQRQVLPGMHQAQGSTSSPTKTTSKNKPKNPL